MDKLVLPEPGELMTVSQAAAILGVNSFTIRRWIKSGKLEAMRIGEKLLKIKPDSLTKFIEACQLPKVEPTDLSSCGNLKGQLIQQAISNLENMNPDQILTLEQVASLTGKNIEAIKKARQRGSLTGIRQGRNWSYRPKEVKAWLENLAGIQN